MKTESIIKLNWSNTITFKSVVIGIISLLLLIPLAMITSIISERENTAREVESNISDQFGTAQTLVGPILNVPVDKQITNQEGIVTRGANLAPSDAHKT
jgi:inner membrane protein